jgi:hypothetical protein
VCEHVSVATQGFTVALPIVHICMTSDTNEVTKHGDRRESELRRPFAFGHFVRDLDQIAKATFFARFRQTAALEACHSSIYQGIRI